MSLNVKNEEACRLAAELARLTGETKIGAITVALRERLDREQRRSRVDSLASELHEIGQRCAKLLKPGPSAVEHGDFLHDERGDDATLLARARTVAGDSLKAVLLHGSWVRGAATATSDVDALIVADRHLRLNRDLYRTWDAEPIAWQGRRVDAHFVHLPEEETFSGLWAEAAIDGQVLFDRDGSVSNHLLRVRRAIAEGRLMRRVAHGQPYWTEAS